MHENIVVYSKNDRLCTKEMNDKKNDDVAWVFVLHRNLSLPLNIKILLIAGSLLLFFCYTMWPFSACNILNVQTCFLDFSNDFKQICEILEHHIHQANLFSFHSNIRDI